MWFIVAVMLAAGNTPTHILVHSAYDMDNKEVSTAFKTEDDCMKEAVKFLVSAAKGLGIKQTYCVHRHQTVVE